MQPNIYQNQFKIYQLQVPHVEVYKIKLYAQASGIELDIFPFRTFDAYSCIIHFQLIKYALCRHPSIIEKINYLEMNCSKKVYLKTSILP